MKPPVVPEQPVPVVTDEQIKALLAGCAGRDLVSRRDEAIIRLLMDTGGAALKSRASPSTTSISSRT